MQIALLCEDPNRQPELEAIAIRWGLTHDQDNVFALVLTTEKLELRKRDEPKLGAIFVDLVSGAVAAVAIDLLPL